MYRALLLHDVRHHWLADGLSAYFGKRKSDEIWLYGIYMFKRVEWAAAREKLYGSSIFNIIYNINRPIPLVCKSGQYPHWQSWQAVSLRTRWWGSHGTHCQQQLNSFWMICNWRWVRKVLYYSIYVHVLYCIIDMRLGDFLVSNVGIIIRDADVPYGLDKSWLETIPGLYCCCCVIIVETRSNCTQHVTAWQLVIDMACSTCVKFSSTYIQQQLLILSEWMKRKYYI